MGKKSKFWCFRCKTEYPMSRKSPTTCKPPYKCIGCAIEIGEHREAAKTLAPKKDYQRGQYLNGSAGRHLKDL